MLTYASIEDFKQMKDLGKAGIVAIPTSADDKIDIYLERATRFIDRFTRRQFYPWRETRTYPVPYAYYDLTIRRFPSAHLKLDADLLEVFTVNNGVKDLEADDFYLIEKNVYPKSIVVLKFPNYWGGLTQTALRRYDQPILSIDSMWGYADYQYPAEYWIDTNEVVEAGGITDTQTTLTFVNVDGDDDWGKVRISENYLIRIEDELIEVVSTNTTSNTATVKRGVRGTTKAAHDEGTTITRWRVIEDIVEACLQIAKTWREADLAAGGRIGVSDVSTGAELSIPSDPLNTIKMYARSILYG